MPKSPILRFIIIEAAIFGIVALLSQWQQWNFSIVLTVVGTLLMIARFSSTPRQFGRHLGVEAMEQQYLRDATDPRIFRRSQALFNDLFLIALPPLIVGLLLGLV